MRRIVFDIETCCYPFESFTESQQEYLLRYSEREKTEELRMEKREEAIRFTSLYPFTASVVAIGIFDVEKEKSFVYYNHEPDEEFEENNVRFKGLSETEMLKSFWRIIEVTDQVITFNGKNFDSPFLMLRSALLRIKPSKNLIGKKYDTSSHIDLLEQFTYFGLTRKFNLDFYCHAFGVESPKSKGITGMDVKDLYEAGRVKEIASYCSNDIYATYQLYKIWNEFLNI